MAWSYYEEAHEFLKEIGDINFLAYLVRRLEQLAWQTGNFKEVIERCSESLHLNREVGDTCRTLACLAGFRVIAAAQGKYERAARLMAAVETQLASPGIRLLYVDKMEDDHSLALLSEEFEEKLFGKYREQGKSLSLEQAIALALGGT